MADRRAALFVLNPASGSDDADATEAAVVERLEGHGVDVDVRRTEGEGDARRWAAEAATDGDVDLLVVAGGDGSVREAVSGVVAADGDVPVGIVATGTANLLARALGLPVDDPGAAGDVAATGVGRGIDVVHLLGREDHAVVMVDAGFDARLVRDADRGRKDLLGPLAYVIAGLRNLFTLEQVDLELRLDDRDERVHAHSVLCLNIGRIGDTVVVDRDITPDDGLLHVGVVSRPWPHEAAATAVGMVVGDREQHPNVEWHECRRVRVEATPPLQVQVDGEPADETPFELELLPGAVTILVPADEA